MVWPLTLTDISIVAHTVSVTISFSKCVKATTNSSLLWLYRNVAILKIIIIISLLSFCSDTVVIITAAMEYPFLTVTVSQTAKPRFFHQHGYSRCCTCYCAINIAFRLLTATTEIFFLISLNGSISVDVLQAGPNVPEMAGNMRHCSPSNQGTFIMMFFSPL